MEIDYSKQYLKSDWWLYMKEKALTKYGRVCVECGKEDNLHVHHNSYEHILNEAELDDLVVLCKGCHYKRHFKKDGTPIRCQPERQTRIASCEFVRYNKNSMAKTIKQIGMNNWIYMQYLAVGLEWGTNVIDVARFEKLVLNRSRIFRTLRSNDIIKRIHDKTTRRRQYRFNPYLAQKNVDEDLYGHFDRNNMSRNFKFVKLNCDLFPKLE